MQLCAPPQGGGPRTGWCSVGGFRVHQHLRTPAAGLWGDDVRVSRAAVYLQHHQGAESGGTQALDTFCLQHHRLVWDCAVRGLGVAVLPLPPSVLISHAGGGAPHIGKDSLSPPPNLIWCCKALAYPAVCRSAAGIAGMVVMLVMIG